MDQRSARRRRHATSDVPVPDDAPDKPSACSDSSAAAAEARRGGFAVGEASPGRRPGMRTLLALAVGTLALGVGATASLLADRAASERPRRAASTELAQAAHHIADMLDRDMAERWRDVQIATSHPVLRDPGAAPAAKREVLRLLESTYPEYAILFLIGPDSRITVTSSGIIEGADVSRRDYFVNGRHGPFAGDVHEAVLLARHLGTRPNGEPPRFVDLAAPVPAPDGGPAGVLAAHLFWDWAEGVERGVLGPLRAERPGAEALVLAQDGTVLLGPAALRGRKFAELGSFLAARAGEAGARREAWAGSGGEKEWLVGFAPTRGHAGYPGLGWTVLVRQDSAEAFAAARALKREIFLWGGVVAAVAALLSWLLAHAATRPVRALTAIADRLAREPAAAAGAEQEAERVSRASLSYEGAALGTATAGLISSQRRAAAALAASEARFARAVAAAEIGAWDWDVALDRVTGSPGFEALLGRPPGGIATKGDFLASVHAADREAVLAVVGRAAAGADGDGLEVEYRVPAPEGRKRCLRSQGAVTERGPDGAPLRMSGVVIDVTARRAAEAALLESEERLRLAQAAGSVGVWDWDVAGDALAWSGDVYGAVGLDASDARPPLARFLRVVHPEDRGRVRASADACLAPGGPAFDLEFRVVDAAGAVRWLAGRGEVAARDPATGRALRVVGTNMDVTVRREAAERQTLLAREVDHRAKNALAVAQSILRLTRAADARAYRVAVEGRISALARAHTLLARDKWRGAGLRAILEEELAPYAGGAADDADPPRIALGGAPVLLAPAATQPLAMALHELATNAVKHGALSAEGGRLRVSWRLDGAPGGGGLRVVWEEHGTRPLAGPPARRGFGSGVVEATIRQQLGGTVRFR